ncbi:hypothetical protein N431DRAFT_487636 [Stipitochalara longipes BDJ]|nr:hypothetical protein N431DRAFT_487636 [Stipitochalara longipes BDJ]
MKVTSCLMIISTCISAGMSTQVAFYANGNAFCESPCVDFTIILGSRCVSTDFGCAGTTNSIQVAGTDGCNTFTAFGSGDCSGEGTVLPADGSCQGFFFGIGSIFINC